MKIHKDEATGRDYFWYSPGEVTFQREHVLFLLEYYELLERNKYPPEPTGSFIEVATVTNIRPQWNHALNLKAEMDYRLKTCKEAGEALKWEVTNGLTEVELLSPPAKRALGYVSGWKRKKMGFTRWCNQNRRRDDNERS